MRTSYRTNFNRLVRIGQERKIKVKKSSLNRSKSESLADCVSKVFNESERELREFASFGDASIGATDVWAQRVHDLENESNDSKKEMYGLKLDKSFVDGLDMSLKEFVNESQNTAFVFNDEPLTPLDSPNCEFKVFPELIDYTISPTDDHFEAFLRENVSENEDEDEEEEPEIPSSILGGSVLGWVSPNKAERYKSASISSPPKLKSPIVDAHMDDNVEDNMQRNDIGFGDVDQMHDSGGYEFADFTLDDSPRDELPSDQRPLPMDMDFLRMESASPVYEPAEIPLDPIPYSLSGDLVIPDSELELSDIEEENVINEVENEVMNGIEEGETANLVNEVQNEVKNGINKGETENVLNQINSGIDDGEPENIEDVVAADVVEETGKVVSGAVDAIIDDVENVETINATESATPEEELEHEDAEHEDAGMFASDSDSDNEVNVRITEAPWTETGLGARRTIDPEETTDLTDGKRVPNVRDKNHHIEDFEELSRNMNIEDQVRELPNKIQEFRQSMVPDFDPFETHSPVKSEPDGGSAIKFCGVDSDDEQEICVDIITDIDESDAIPPDMQLPELEPISLRQFESKPELFTIPPEEIAYMQDVMLKYAKMFERVFSGELSVESDNDDDELMYESTNEDLSSLILSPGQYAKREDVLPGLSIPSSPQFDIGSDYGDLGDINPDGDMNLVEDMNPVEDINSVAGVSEPDVSNGPAQNLESENYKPVVPLSEGIDFLDTSNNSTTLSDHQLTSLDVMRGDGGNAGLFDTFSPMRPPKAAGGGASIDSALQGSLHSTPEKRVSQDEDYSEEIDDDSSNESSLLASSDFEPICEEKDHFFENDRDSTDTEESATSARSEQFKGLLCRLIDLGESTTLNELIEERKMPGWCTRDYIYSTCVLGDEGFIHINQSPTEVGKDLNPIVLTRMR